MVTKMVYGSRLEPNCNLKKKMDVQRLSHKSWRAAHKSSQRDLLDYSHSWSCSVVQYMSKERGTSCTLSPSAFGDSFVWELHETRLGECDSRRQPGKTRDPLTRAHGPLKKWDLNEARHERQGYKRGSKVRRVFPSTLSLLPCLGFPRWQCTVSIIWNSQQDMASL